MTNDVLPRLMVYRRDVLGLSETFILSQVRAMRRYQPHLFGLRQVNGLHLGEVPVHTLGAGKLSKVRELMFRYAGIGPSLYGAARECQPSLVHAHFAMDGAECLPIAEEMNIPLVVTLHGYDVTTTDRIFQQTWIGRRFLSIRQKLWSRTSVFLCVSGFIRDQAVKRGFPPHKLMVHYIGVDTAKLVPTPAQAREKVVLFVGRLVEKKGLTYLLRAFAAGGETCAAAKLVVIGDGPLRAQHEAEAAQLGVECKFLGAQSNDVVHDWMRRSQVLAVPSVQAKSGDREGLPTVLFEAFSLGLPAVAFSSGGIPDAVSFGTGLLASEGNVEEFGAQLKLLLQNVDLRNRLAAGARQRAVESFDVSRQTAKLEAIYDRAIEKRSAVPVQ